MKYFISIFPLALLIYMLSFAKYNWTRNNKLAAVGATLIGVAAFALSVYVIFFAEIEA